MSPVLLENTISAVRAPGGVHVLVDQACAVPKPCASSDLLGYAPRSCSSASVGALLRLSRSEVYEQIKERRLLTVHQGRAVFVTADDLAAYVDLLRQEARAAR